jgi:hypothetical protein
VRHGAPVQAAPREQATEGASARLDALYDALTLALDGAPLRFPDPPAGPEAPVDRLARTFALDPAAMAALLLAAAEALRPGVPGDRPATVALVHRAVGAAAWAALCPQAPLRRWRMVEPDGRGPLPGQALRIDERVLHHLAGIDYYDARLDGFVTPLPVPPDACGNVAATALAARWDEAATGTMLPLVALTGGDALERPRLAGAVATASGRRALQLDAADIPATPAERHELVRLCERELALAPAVLVVRADDIPAAPAQPLRDLLETLEGPVLLCAETVPNSLARSMVQHALGRPDVHGRSEAWQRALGTRAGELDPAAAARLARQFTLAQEGVTAAVQAALDPLGDRSQPLEARLWEAARRQCRSRLEGLGERIVPAATWDDIVLPPERMEALHDIAVHVRRAVQVEEDWGWRAKGTRGLGIAALFSGPSGTGKTMAAEILANELHLDLFRIDLSQLVSKYIGETEKNLARVFAGAEASGAILLFDEADALFGKRSDVKDSHDRYANVEVSYLLQQMEAYRGLAVLTTNLRNSLDRAFLRRLRFVIEFPFPDQAQRAAIWRRIFPPETPLAELDEARLARLSIAGGNIRTIALNASFMAAEAGERVGSRHIAAAAQREYAKLGKSVTAAEFGDGA